MSTQKVSMLTAGDLILHLRSELEKAERSWVDGNLSVAHNHLFNISQMGNWAAEKVYKAINAKSAEAFNDAVKSVVKSSVITCVKPKHSPVWPLMGVSQGIEPLYNDTKIERKQKAFQPLDDSWQKVISSNVSAIRYNSSTKVLMIQFKDEHIYRYENVPGNVYVGLLASVSKGRFFHNNIKGKFVSSRIA